MMPSPTQLQQRVLQLIHTHQYRSAELVALMDQTDSPSSRAATLELLGDACHYQGKHASAAQYYREALLLVQQHRGANQDNVEQYVTVLTLKECRAVKESGAIEQALGTLERAFVHRRTFETAEKHMLMGDLYRQMHRPREAAEEYRRAVRKDPYLLEALEHMAQLGYSFQKDDEIETVPLPKEMVQDWHTIVLAQETLYKNQLVSSHRHFTHLSTRYPRHPYFLLQLAHIEQERGYILSSEQHYQRVRELDPHWIEGMDRYAHLLFQLRMSRKNAFVMERGGYLQYHYSCYGARDDTTANNREKCTIQEALGTLCTDMLHVDDTKPEAWNCLSLYHLAREDYEKALAFVDKAIAIQSEYAFSHLLRGSILLTSHRADHARVEFYKANELQRDIPSYEGLVESYLAGGHYREAVNSAKEAITLCPRDPRAITLVGLALAQAPTSQLKGEGKERAKRALKKAITLDHGALRPLFALVDLYASDGEYTTCIQLLQDGIENGGKVAENTPLCSVTTWNKAHVDVIQAKMGEIYMLNEEWNEALECYHTAISLNPQNGLALQGIVRLEKLLKGIDPDNDEEEEMGEEGGVHEEDVW